MRLSTLVPLSAVGMSLSVVAVLVVVEVRQSHRPVISAFFEVARGTLHAKFQ